MNTDSVAELLGPLFFANTLEQTAYDYQQRIDAVRRELARSLIGEIVSVNDLGHGEILFHEVNFNS